MLCKWERADAFACGRKDSIAHSRKHRWQGRFTEPGGCIICLAEMHFDFRRNLGHAYRLILVEIALERASAIDGDFVGHDAAETFNDCSPDLIEGVAGINDVTADITGDPNLFYLNRVVFVDGQIYDFGEITAMRKVECHSPADA